MADSNSTDFSVRLVAASHGTAQAAVTIVEFLDRRLVDAARIERLGDQIVDLVNTSASPKLVISFAKVEYLSSSMLNALIEIDKTIKRRKGQMRLANLDPDLMKVFTLMNLDKVMKICSTTEEAVASL